MGKSKFAKSSLLVLILVLAIGVWRYSRPLPTLHAQLVNPKPDTGTAIQLPWPAYGQGAFGAVGFGVLASHNTDTPAPIASVAKAVTAMAILKEKPLLAGQPGPSVTITEADVQSYRDYAAKGGSVVPVTVGEQISELDALQAMMLPSANNIADTAARWAFGSVDNYLTYANQYVKSLGMNQTKIADASGFSAQTTSTARDLVVIGEAALQTPVLATIVNQGQANFPSVGVIKNVNWLLGTDGIIGIKTGETDEAKGCYLFGAKRVVDGQPVTVVGAILGAPTRNQAMTDSRTLIQAADKGFGVFAAVQPNQTVGRYNLPWGGAAYAVTASSLQVLNWKGSPLITDTNFKDLQPPVSKDASVGTLKIKRYDALQDANTVTLKLKQPIGTPSWAWRIFR